MKANHLPSRVQNTNGKTLFCACRQKCRHIRSGQTQTRASPLGATNSQIVGSVDGPKCSEADVLLAWPNDRFARLGIKSTEPLDVLRHVALNHVGSELPLDDLPKTF